MREIFSTPAYNDLKHSRPLPAAMTSFSKARGGNFSIIWSIDALTDIHQKWCDVKPLHKLISTDYQLQISLDKIKVIGPKMNKGLRDMYLSTLEYMQISKTKDPSFQHNISACIYPNMNENIFSCDCKIFRFLIVIQFSFVFHWST